MDSLPLFLTVPEVAEVLRLSEWRVYEIIRQGLLPCVKIGRQVRVEAQAFQSWVDQGGSSQKSLAQQAS